MKLKSILLFVILLVVYHFFTVNYLSKSKITANQGQWSDNAIKGQYFLYNFSTKPYNCIVGSSLSALLPRDKLPDSYYNLSFSGQSVHDGLSLLAYKKSLPDTLFIEYNVINKAQTKEFIDKLVSNDISVDLKENLTFLQERNRPFGILSNVMELFITKLERVRLLYKYGIAIIKNKLSKKDNNHFPESKMLNAMINGNNKKPNIEFTKENISKVCKILIELDRQNVKLVFFEMPVLCELENTPQMVLNRDLIFNYFPASKYSYLLKTDCSKFKTTDGIHLNSESAVKYALLFSQQKHFKAAKLN